MSHRLGGRPVASPTGVESGFLVATLELDAVERLVPEVFRFKSRHQRTVGVAAALGTEAHAIGAEEAGLADACHGDAAGAHAEAVKARGAGWVTCEVVAGRD